MSEQPLMHYVTVTREIKAPIGEVWGIVAGFGAERAWYPGAKKVSLQGFGIGSLRTFEYEYTFGKSKGQTYTFSEELTACVPEKHSMTFRVKRPDYPEMIAYGTTVLDEVGPDVTRFRWIAEGSALPEELVKVLKADLTERFGVLIDAVAKQVE